jgi:uracil-DNA glycosylase
MTEKIKKLIEATRCEAQRVGFPIDTEVYERSGRDPAAPILFAGSLDAPLCIVGRDLGKDEVRAGQPLIGAAGRSVREGIMRACQQKHLAGGGRPNAGTAIEEALEYALLTNTVPFKPPGNKAYSDEVRRRFRPFLELLLIEHWSGERVITLGAQAFEWFQPYGDKAAFEKDGASESRFKTVFHCKLSSMIGTSHDKIVTVYPLPHPSPLNRRWFSRFPSMLAERLDEVWA